MNHRVNISFSSKEFHAQAVTHAEYVHKTDLSGLITKLIVEDIRRERELVLAERKTKPQTPQNNQPSWGQLIAFPGPPEDEASTEGRADQESFFTSLFAQPSILSSMSAKSLDSS